MNRLRNAREWVAFATVLVVLGTVQIAWGLVVPIAWCVLPPTRRRVIGRFVISWVFRQYFVFTRRMGVLEVDATDLDTMDPHESLIIAANHPSGLDALILISRFENQSCIMKASMLGNLLLGPGARLAEYIRNDSPRRMLRLAVAELKRGGRLIVFPEATRTVSAPVNEFRGGFAAISRIAHVPIQTVFVETDTPFLSKGWSVLRKPAHLPMRYRVRLGRRFEVGDDLGGFVNGLRDYFVDELQGARLGDLWARSPPEPMHPFAYPMRCPDLVDDVAPAHTDDEGDAVPSKWRPARSHSATQW